MHKDKDFDWNILHTNRAHPWHGVFIGANAPSTITCYIEIVPIDTVKLELDKITGLLKIDRPQKYSNCCPTLYGMIPQTYAGDRIGQHCMEKTHRPGIRGDGDPLDICVLTEKPILRGDILLQAIPIGGFLAIDGQEADDKIIAVLQDDLVYKKIQDISDCPPELIDRLQHYFLTYKESPQELDGSSTKERKLLISHVYDRQEALKVITLARLDYQENFEKMWRIEQLLRGGKS